MPIYEYRCSECGQSFEKWQRSMVCEEQARCPKCGSQKVKKAVSVLGSIGNSSSSGSCAPATGG